VAYTVKREEGVTVDLHLIPEPTLLGNHLYPNAIKYSSHKRDRRSLRLSMNCRHGSSFASIAHSVATCIGGMHTSAMHVTSDTIVERGTHTCCMRKLQKHCNLSWHKIVTDNPLQYCSLSQRQEKNLEPTQRHYWLIHTNVQTIPADPRKFSDNPCSP